MMVYLYDEENNRFKPYMADNVKLGSEYPSKEIKRLFDDIEQNTSRPPKLKRIIVGSQV